MDQFKLYELYTFEQINSVAENSSKNENNIEISEHGLSDEIFGAAFICLSHFNGAIVSFVLHSAPNLNFYYKCIYSDFKKDNKTSD